MRTITDDWPAPLCHHDSTVLRWVEDAWYCPKCRDEFHGLDPDEDGGAE